MGGQPSGPSAQKYDFSSVDDDIFLQAQQEIVNESGSGTSDKFKPVSKFAESEDKALFNRIQKIQTERAASTANPFLGVIKRGVTKNEEAFAGATKRTVAQDTSRRKESKVKLSLLDEDTKNNKTLLG